MHALLGREARGGWTVKTIEGATLNLYSRGTFLDIKNEIQHNHAGFFSADGFMSIDDMIFLKPDGNYFKILHTITQH